MSAALRRLEELLRQQGGLIAGLVASAGAGAVSGGSPPVSASSDPEHPLDRANGTCLGPAQRTAQGPRAAGRSGEYELLMEAIYEGYLLHYGTPRIVRPPEADLALLAGDQLYALGLARLVGLGDVEAVSELADVITLCALAHGGGELELADAVWQAGARAIGWGTSPEHERAKALARAGSDEALAAMRAAASV